MVLFHLAVSKDLLSSEVLLLHGPESLLLLLCLSEHLGFLDLESSLVHHSSSLLGAESLEVVWLDSVWSEHRLLSLWVLSHEIVGQSKVLLVVALELSICVLSSLSVLLLLCKLAVGVSSCLLHSGQSICLVLLCLVE